MKVTNFIKWFLIFILISYAIISIIDSRGNIIEKKVCSRITAIENNPYVLENHRHSQGVVKK